MGNNGLSRLSEGNMKSVHVAMKNILVVFILSLPSTEYKHTERLKFPTVPNDDYILNPTINKERNIIFS